MTDALAELPNNVDELKAIIRDYEKKLLWAEEKYRAMELRYFGQKSEHYRAEDDKQNRLFDEAEEHAAKSPPPPGETMQIPAHERAKRGRKTKTAATERIEIVHDLTDDEQRCPCCGEKRPSIGEDRTAEYAEP
jgi:transposase